MTARSGDSRRGASAELGGFRICVGCGSARCEGNVRGWMDSLVWGRPSLWGVDIGCRNFEGLYFGQSEVRERTQADGDVFHGPAEEFF